MAFSLILARVNLCVHTRARVKTTIKIYNSSKILYRNTNTSFDGVDVIV